MNLKLLQFASNKGIMTLTDVESLGKDEKMNKIEKEIKKTHNYSIYQEGERWRTVVPDITKKRGTRSIVRKSKEDLYAFLIDFYGLDDSISKKDLPTFSEFFELAMNEKLSDAKEEKRDKAKNNVERIKRDYRRYISNSIIENKPLNTISKSEIIEVIKLNLKKYDLKPRALEKLKTVLHAVYKYAYYHDLIEENIVYRIDFSAFSKMTINDKTKNSKRMHTEEELIMILDALHDKQKKNPLKSSFWALEMQILMGGRRGEMPTLKWENIKDKWIEITQEQLTVGNDFKIDNSPKNGKDRCYPLDNNLLEFLLRLKERNDKYYPNSEFLFPDKRTKSGIITNRAVYEVYRKLIPKLGIKKEKGVIKGPHSFRRNSISFFVNNSGGNFQVASTIYGNSPAVAKEFYYGGIDIDSACEVLNKRTFKSV